MSENIVGIVTVTVDGVRYRGAYKNEDQDFVVSAVGLGSERMDASLVADGDEKVVLNLAKLMLAGMVQAACETDDGDLRLTMQGSTSTICF